jgi:hypothetical protein
MGEHGAVYQPELVKLMKAVLEDAAATLPVSRRTSAMMAESGEGAHSQYRCCTRPRLRVPRKCAGTFCGYVRQSTDRNLTGCVGPGTGRSPKRLLRICA